MKYLYKTRLLNLREINNIKQSYISKLLGFKNSDTYGQFEREDTLIPITHLNKLCNYFDCSIDYIFSLTNHKKYILSNSNINLEISSKRLKKLRLENNLSQKEFAKIINCHYSTISNYENKKRYISTEILYKICTKYKISADYLLGKTNNPKII